jgi:hypothetical protein
LILSLLPSIFGSTLSVILIEYSKPLSYVGLAIVLGFAVLYALKLKRELYYRNTKISNQLKNTKTVIEGVYDNKEDRI